MLNLNLLDLVRKQVQLVTMTLSQESKLNELFDLMPDEEISKLIKNSPTWFQYYCSTHHQMLFEMIASNDQMKAEFNHIQNQPDSLNFMISDAEQILVTNANDLNQLKQSKGKLSFQFEESSQGQEAVIAMLARSRAMTATLRSQNVYGQSIHALIQAGINGNDEGFIRAVSIDPTVQAHPAIVDRMSRSRIAKSDKFLNTLLKAAVNGPTKRFEKDHNQLRYVLGFLYELGLLQKLSSEQRYQLFCIDLALYPVTGKDPEAGLRIFIDRWEKNLVL